MKKTLCLLLVVLCVVSLFFLNGCNGDKNDIDTSSKTYVPLPTASRNIDGDIDNSGSGITAVDADFTYTETKNGITITGFKEDVTDVTTLIIPNDIDGKNVVAIEEEAFAKNDTIRQVIVGSNVKKIGDYAFASCSNLQVFLSGASVTEFGSNILDNCISLNVLSLNEGLKKIGKYAFQGIKARQITIPDSVTAVDNIFGSTAEYVSVIGLGGGYIEHWCKINNIFFTAHS